MMIDTTPELASTAIGCLDVDPDTFFPETTAGVNDAKRVCAGCPLRIECLNGALRRGEPHGVWGGELFLDGEIIAQKRPRGRPRKNELAAAA